MARDIELSVKEFELLDYFMSNQGIALTRSAYLTVCGVMIILAMRGTIDTHVKKLRSKMGAKGRLYKDCLGCGI